jgi:hypothetical protein
MRPTFLAFLLTLSALAACLKGPRPDENPCQVHGSKSVCNTSTLGCTWNEAESKCVRKAN